ncbi:hypothetical protein [Pandoraea communis]|uniref:2-oxo-hepta-3-ene-1,7-dioate hydratase n=1 Tax=Pandoraea communis TaxID=2508297 RepID=A0A5E4XW76_9BURK|nr:2-oxo-hepta-3-ene-1,7-dioate hydratase [Pandoraea communis]
MQFSRRYPDMTITGSYAISRAWLALKSAQGRRMIGHKIGLTSCAMQVAAQIAEPDHGTLLANKVGAFDEGLQAGEIVLAGSFTRPVA